MNASRGVRAALPVRGDLSAHARTVTPPWGYSDSSETPLSDVVYCVTVAFTMTEQVERKEELREKTETERSKNRVKGSALTMENV